MDRRKSLQALMALGLAAGLATGPALAADDGPVRVGALLPLTGNAASAGGSAKAALELAVDIVNNAHPDLSAMPLAEGEGLPNLGGRKIELVPADQQGSPSAGQNQALRLITQENVDALYGAYQSGITQTASAVAERYGKPFLTGASVAPGLTERGFKWFFRTTPIGPDIARIYMDFIEDQKSKGVTIDKIAVVNENSEYGTSIADVIISEGKSRGLPVDLQLPYAANSADVSSQVLQLKQENPDVVIFISYTSDAILYTRTMQSQGYKPTILIGDDSGFSDPSYIQTVGDIAQGVINRSAFDASKEGSNSAKVNALFKEKTGRDLDDTTARMMQGFLVLVDAINRAGSTDPAAIQKALQETDLGPDQLMIGYNGVKFNEKGQNEKAAALLVQLQGDKYISVWPDDRAAGELKLPFQGWE